jgi:hypothetical protein
MANKKISELESRASLSLSDLMAVGDPSTGYLYKTTISDLKTLTGAGVVSFNGRFGTVNPAEGDYTLTQLGDVIITSPSNGQVLKYNGSNWVNASDVTEADTLDTVTTRGNTTANSITVGSVTAAGLSNLLGQIRTFATTGNTYIGANPGSATDAGFKLDVLGTTRLNGNTTVTGVLTGSDTIRSTNGTVTVSLSYGSTAGIIGTTSNHSLEIRTNNTYRVGVSTAGVLNIANLIGTGSRMVVADSAGNLSTQAIPDLSGYLPLSGGTLTGGLIGTTGSFASSGSGDTFAINHSSGSGIALNITKGGNGEGLYINKTGGSGNAATIIGTLNATTLVKSGGTSSQFLKADGSVDSNTYATDSSVVHISGTETITGAKTFSNVTTFNQNIVGGIIKLSQGVLLSKSAAVGTDAGFLSLIATSATGLNYINIADGDAPSNTQRFAIPNTGTYTYTFPAASGTLALTSDIPSVAGVYLPLAGGTLTGALNGTTATFSGTMQANKYVANAQSTYASLTYEETLKYSSSPAGIWFGNSFNSNNNVALQLRTSNDGASVQALTLSPTGAATFSGSVRSNEQNAFQLFQSGNPTDTKLWSIQNLSSSGQFRIRAGNDAETNGINAIVISRTGISSISLDFNGAATFSSSVTAGGDVTAYSLLVNRAVSRNMLGISSTSLPTGGDEEGVVVIKTNHSIWQQSIVGYAVDSKGLRVYNTGGSSYTSFEVAQGNGTKLIVAGSGNVGINTTNPTYTLDVTGSLRTTAGTYLATTSSNVIIGGTTSDTTNQFKFITIGNTAFQYGASTGTYLRIEPGAADTEVALKADARSGNYPPMTFYTSAVERMRITGSGDYNYGAGNPQHSSNSVYRQAFYGALSIMWRNAEDSYINSNHTYSSSNTNIASYASSNGIGRLGIYGGNLEWGSYNGSVSAGTAYTLTSRLTITKEGNVEMTSGSIKTGSPTGGTAQPWKFGEATNTLYTATRTVKVEINGALYYLLAVASSDL